LGRGRSRRVVPPDAQQLTAAAFRPLLAVDEQRSYGYHWYVGTLSLPNRTPPRREKWIGAFGNGGQQLFIIPGLDLVVVVTADNYNAPDQWKPPLAMLRDVVLPSLSTD
jgi:CubicO group peptidase (beta-lactamase class C family)